ncbi:MAG: membrane protein insertase YidC [Bacteroidota bacterium]
MDRRTLLAIVLIMGVLVIDQVIWGPKEKPRQVPPPPAGAPAAPGNARADSAARAAAAESVREGRPLAQPGEASSSAARFTGTASGEGGPLVPARVAPAPAERDSLVTDRFRAGFTNVGASVSSWVLPAYQDPRRHAPVDLIPPGGSAMHVEVGAGAFNYDFSGAPFHRTGSARQGTITYVAEDSSGIRVTKSFRLSRDPHLLEVEIRVSAPPALGPIRYRMGWAEPLPLTELNARPVERTAVAYLGAKLETIDEGRIAKEGTRRLSGNVRWAGERTKYFIATVIPDSATVTDVVFQQGPDKLPIVWLSGTAPPGMDLVRHARIYAGPIHFDTLVQIGAGLEDLANLGWKWIVPVSAVLLKALIGLYKVIPNYGIAIIIIALAAKLIFYPLTQSSLRTMKVMHRLQPEVNAIREKHANDPAKMNSAMLNLYKEHKVNPMGGCLPMLLQLPVFLALYQVLLHAIELRSAGFAGWIKDLSAPDVVGHLGGFPIHVLPLIMTGSTFLLQSQTPVDPRQQFMMYLMPVMMLYIMYNLPSGVIIYWTVNNLVSALQQYLVNVAEDRRMAAQT